MEDDCSAGEVRRQGCWGRGGIAGGMEGWGEQCVKEWVNQRHISPHVTEEKNNPERRGESLHLHSRIRRCRRTSSRRPAKCPVAAAQRPTAARRCSLVMQVQYLVCRRVWFVY